jgi:hypothetical protein
MKLITFVIRIFLDAYRDTKRVVQYFNLIEINGLSVVPKFFFIRLFFSFSTVRNFKKIEIIKNVFFNNFFEQNNVSSENIAIQIDKLGYSDTYTLKENYTNDVIKEIFVNQEIKYKKSNNDSTYLKKMENEDLNSYLARLKKKNVSRITGFIDLNNFGQIRKLLTSEPFTSLASNYLNCKSFSISAAYFISNPCDISEEEKYRNAQYFHWDNDFTKFLKLYIYLTDVETGSGPHIFIPGTHKNKLFKHRLCRLYSDQNIYEAYKERIEFLGNKGSLFFVDSYGLHKGETPRNKSRLILNVHFGKQKILYSKNDIYFKI